VGEAVAPRAPSTWPMWVLGLVIMIDQVDQNIVRGVVPQLKEAFGINDAQIGLLLSAFVVVNGLVTVPAGYLADRWNRTRTIGHTVVGWSAITMLTAAAAHLRPGGTFAAALMDLTGEPVGGDYVPPGPDMRDVDGCVYSSQPVGLRSVEGGAAISVDRVRTVIDPRGERTSTANEIRLELLSPDVLEEEVVAAGLVLAGRRTVPATEDHVGSVVVLATAS